MHLLKRYNYRGLEAKCTEERNGYIPKIGHDIVDTVVILCYNGIKKGGVMMKEKISIGKWLIAILVGIISSVIGIVGFFISYIEMGIVFLLFGVVIIAFYIMVVPHSFMVDSEKITAIYVFRKKNVKYVDIKSCAKEESGIRNYPWGAYYHIIVDKPFFQEIKIPYTKEIERYIGKYLK